MRVPRSMRVLPARQGTASPGKRLAKTPRPRYLDARGCHL